MADLGSGAEAMVIQVADHASFSQVQRRKPIDLTIV